MSEIVLISPEGESYHLPRRSQNRAYTAGSLCGHIDAETARRVDKSVARANDVRPCQHCLTQRNAEARRTQSGSSQGDPPTSLDDVPSWRGRS